MNTGLDLDFLGLLCNTDGVSGREDAVNSLLRTRL